MANCIRCGRQLPGFSFGKKVCQWCVHHEAYQRGEIADDAPQPIMRQPWTRRRESVISLTQIFFGICIVVFLGMAPDTLTISGFPGEHAARWGANFGPYTLSGEWWRLLTYMFMHANLMHIAFNMWCLWDLGGLCESLYGRWTYAAIYLMTGVGAGLGSIVWNEYTLTVGASGAVFGLAGALLAAFKLGEFSIPREALSGTMRSLMIFVGFNLVFGFTMSGIDNAAHIGGLITGLVLGALIALFAPHQDHAPRRVAIFAAAALALTGVAMALTHHYDIPLRLGRASTLPENNPGDQVAQYKKLVRLNPKFVPGHIALAKAYLQQGQVAPAEKELQRALELDPKSTEARLHLGLLYLNSDRPQDAQKTFQDELALNANNADAHFGLGLALAAQHNDQAAVEEYKTAIHLDPQATDIQYNLGLAYERSGDYDDAIAAFLKEQQLGDSADLENALAKAYDAKGQPQQAEAARAKAAQLKSPAP